MSLGFLSFLSPLPLFGLLALPVIWWLLRTTPPSPSRQEFPPTRILKRLLQDKTTSAHSPWWLTLLRLIAAALIIFALAQPVINSAAPLLTASTTSSNGPVVLMVDNGWASAANWKLRKIMMNRLLLDAQEQQRLVFLLPTAPNEEGGAVQPISATDAMLLVERMEPSPFSTNRLQALNRLDEGLAALLKDQNASSNEALSDAALYWLSDGLSEGVEVELDQRFKGLNDRGIATNVVVPDEDQLALALTARLGKGGVLYGMVKAVPSPVERTGMILALSGKEEILGRAAFTLAAGASMVESRIELPLELRNQITKLKIEGESSAGSVHLLDQRSNWRRVGLISNESGQLAQPLLSPLYYIRRALEPYAELISDDSKDIAKTVESYTERNVSVVVMADIGRLVGAPLLRLTEWVEKGGVLVRFAGPHMEESQDSLLPTPLRQGGRRLGGALSWSKPQPLSQFDDKSPFAGLVIPSDVVVSRQLLADPSQLRDNVSIWARLKDGTPLVTASRELDGWVVLVHVTANSDWSNLPLSGLFVEMLQRLSQLSVVASKPAADKDGEVTDEAVASEKETLLAPYRTLNGFGGLAKPSVLVEPIAFKDLKTVKIGPKNPPGFYGPAEQTVALNLIDEDSTLKKSDLSALNLKQFEYRKAPEQALRAPLFVAALLLLLLDSLIVLAMRGVLSFRKLQSGTMQTGVVMLAIVLLPLFMATPGIAQEIQGFTPPGSERIERPFRELGQVDEVPQKKSEITDPKLRAALKTHLAYVVTGDSKTDKTSRDGLRGLSYVLNSRTAVEPADPMAVSVEKDELAFFPVLYWPVGPYTKPLSDEVAQRINAYMRHGGMIIFDTKDQDSRIGGLEGRSQSSLQNLLSKLDIPRITPVPKGHVLTKSFYLLSSFPGRYQGGELWVEAPSKSATAKTESTSDIDGVSTLLITSNDLASAWAIDDNYQAQYPVIPGGPMQREMAYRVGVNIVMYALAGNYKADQVHVPALLERLGQ